MGVINSKMSDTLPSTRHNPGAVPSKHIEPAVSQQEIIYWEKLYKERFTRPFILSTSTRRPLFISGFTRNPTPNPRWEEYLDIDIPQNRCNPRYTGATPEPLRTELFERTRHELRARYHDTLVHRELRGWLREVWLYYGEYLPHVPYLKDNVVFPPVGEIKNGHLLPARIRAYILGHNDEMPTGHDPLLTERLQHLALVTGKHLDDLLQAPYENFPLCWSWLSQTTALYFEPVFKDTKNFDQIGRALFSAWRDVDKSRGEMPNLQQRRYFANPVLLLGESRPVADIITTHTRICDAVADEQSKPISLSDSYSWVEHGAEMGVVYRSIIIVVDDARSQWGPSEAACRDYVSEQFSVLLVRTGQEEQLSEPIDFSGLAELPLGRHEVLHDNQQVIRVRLHTAVRFIMDLERREQERCPRLTAMKRVLDNETFCDADAFASDALAMAERNGSIDRTVDTWEAVRRARAYLDGEPFYVEPRLAEMDEYDCDLCVW